MQQQRRAILQVVEWFFHSGGVSQFEFGILAWQPFQKRVLEVILP